MTAVYNLCLLLIQRGRAEGLMDKLDAYLANDRLTAAEYTELCGKLPKEDTTT